MRYLKTTFGAALLTTAMVVAIAACGDDDDDAGPNSRADAGADGTATVDGSKADVSNNNDSGGSCDFNAFVTTLINTQTNATSQPSTDLGDNCVDNQAPFPATLFQ